MASRGVFGEEETIQPYVDALLARRVEHEIGLLIGKLAVGSRDFLFALVKTPQETEALQQEQPAAAAKKGTKKPEACFIIKIKI